MRGCYSINKARKIITNNRLSDWLTLAKLIKIVSFKW